MPLSPEESQTLTNLQQRILTNIAAGKPVPEGISKEEIRAALDLLRGDRGRALAAGEAKKGKKTKVAKPVSPSGTNRLDELLAKRGVDLSKLD